MEHKAVFAKNLQKYMAMNGKSRREVCQALGYSYFTFSDWVNGKKMPRMDKVEQLAKYFGVAKSDLIEEPKKTAPEELGLLAADVLLNPDLLRLVQLYTELGEEDKSMVMMLVENLHQKTKKS